MNEERPDDVVATPARAAGSAEVGPVAHHHASQWRRAALGQFGRGFLALLPLWVGAVPFGITYGVSARAAGLSPLETQLMSLLVFSAAGQLSSISLLELGAPPVVIVLTTLALNVHWLLLGLSLARQMRLTWGGRLVAAFLLTDGAYGVAVAERQVTLPFLLGAGFSMYVIWNAATGVGAVLGLVLPDPHRLGVDVVVPLTFLAVLVPLLRRRIDLLVALVAAMTTLVMAWLGLSSLAILAAGVVGSLVGLWWLRRRGDTAGVPS